MHPPRARWHPSRLVGVAGACLAAAAWAPAARAAPAALVIGNATYSYLPKLPPCTGSANVVAAALRAGGFQVSKKTNLSSGAMEAAIAAFGAKAAGEPKLIYVCGYVGGYNRRDFLLPTSASVGSPPDLLAQGLLARSVLTIPGAAGGLVLLDAIPLPQAPPVPLEAKGRVGVALVAEGNPAADPTPFAALLAQRLAHPPATTDQVVAGLRKALPAGSGARVLSLAVPAPVTWNKPPPPAHPPAPPPAAKASASPPAAPAAAPAPPPAPTFPDESRMTPFQLRQVQIALAQLGYYSGRIDGLAGPETTAAVRRFQQELRQPVTGTLTGAQATRLLEGPR